MQEDSTIYMTHINYLFEKAVQLYRVPVLLIFSFLLGQISKWHAH